MQHEEKAPRQHFSIKRDEKDRRMRWLESGNSEENSSVDFSMVFGTGSIEPSVRFALHGNFSIFGYLRSSLWVHAESPHVHY